MSSTQPTRTNTSSNTTGIYSLPNEVGINSLFSFSISFLWSQSSAFKTRALTYIQYPIPQKKLLIHLLSYASSRTLFRLATVSRRIHDLIIRILHHRLLACTSLEDRNLIFECYHPSEKTTSPPRQCDYLGTDIVGCWDDADAADDGGGAGRGGAGGTGDSNNSKSNTKNPMTRLAGLYSHFRPRKREDRHGTLLAGYGDGGAGAGGAGGQPTLISPTTIAINYNGGIFPVLSISHDPVIEQLSFEHHELFSQLCTVTHLVTHGPRPGLFRSFITISEGTVRVWRDWLAARASCSSSSSSSYSTGSTHTAPTTSSKDEGILWVDPRRNFGMRVKVQEKKWLGDQPILIHEDESPPVSYSVEIEGMKLTHYSTTYFGAPQSKFMLGPGRKGE